MTTPIADRTAGRATAEGTRAFHASSGAARTRRFDGLTLSSIGIGTYLGAEDDPTDEQYAQAIARALESGINVIDTAISYRCQRSERVIGRVLREAFSSGRLRREEVLVASKAGYVPFDGQRPRHMPTYFEETYIKPGLFSREDLVNGVHCMAPRFIEDQIERSRNNLGLETIDVYYLHNPESGMEDVEPELFLRRVQGAFEVLEAAARDGKIGCYGTATWNGYRKAPGTPPHHSLETFLRFARQTGGADHHFKVVQLPYNLALIEAFAVPTQETSGRLAPLLECAAENDVYVMTSAALLQGQLTERLPGQLQSALGFATDAQRAVQFARSTPGVGTSLVGMKRVSHVDEIAAVNRAAPLAPDAIRDLFKEE